MDATIPPIVEFLSVFVLASFGILGLVASVLFYLNIGLREPILNSDNYEQN
ncbi:hypothetical protein [Shewanella sp. TC10]|uniref:hypothetical protein n=1 Tax=Shewanella sp. TC10 TaxID=1419739 RepID=UPI00129E785F|nr:hypothetical protein [Shewanella sp. TC10]